MIRKEQLYEQILEQIDLTKETDDEELQELIRGRTTAGEHRSAGG